MAGQTAAQNMSPNNTSDLQEFRKIEQPQPYLFTGLAVCISFIACAITGGGLAFPGEWILTALIGIVVFNSTKSKYRPITYPVPKKHKLVLTGFSDTDDILKKADDGLRSIKESAEVIAKKNPAFSAKLMQLVNDAYKLVDYVSVHPDQVNQLRRVFNYYIPTLDKLSGTYETLEKEGSKAANVAQTKNEIVAAANAMEDYFKKQSEKMYNNTAMDITTDVDVLESMLAADGIQAKIN